MLDEKLVVDSQDGKKLYAVLNRSKSDKTLAIFVHGLTGDWYKSIPHFFARECVGNNISVARLSLYPGNLGRDLLDTSYIYRDSCAGY